MEVVSKTPDILSDLPCWQGSLHTSQECICYLLERCLAFPQEPLTGLKCPLPPATLARSRWPILPTLSPAGSTQQPRALAFRTDEQFQDCTLHLFLFSHST